jgi:predicted amino acid dehydrogenase
LSIGVVGAAGNIGSVMAQLLGDIASELVVIHRENVGKSAKFQAVIADIERHSQVSREKILPSSDMNDLRRCDVVVLAVNSSSEIIGPEHLREGAIVLDISVPSVIGAQAIADRPDVTFLFGGHIKLPLGQELAHPTFARIGGEVYACLAETIATALADVRCSFSLGSLTKTKVLAAMELGDAVGMELGAEKMSYIRKR